MINSNIFLCSGEVTESHDYVIIPDESSDVTMQTYSVRSELTNLASQIPQETLYTLGTSHDNISLPSELETRLNKVIDNSQLAHEIKQNRFIPIQNDSCKDMEDEVDVNAMDSDKQETEEVSERTANMLMRHLLTKPMPGASVGAMQVGHNPGSTKQTGTDPGQDSSTVHQSLDNVDNQEGVQRTGN